MTTNPIKTKQNQLALQRMIDKNCGNHKMNWVNDTLNWEQLTISRRNLGLITARDLYISYQLCEANQQSATGGLWIFSIAWVKKIKEWKSREEPLTADNADRSLTSLSEMTSVTRPQEDSTRVSKIIFANFGPMRVSEKYKDSNDLTTIHHMIPNKESN